MPGGQGKQMKAEIMRKKGKNVVNDAIYNKGLGFSRSERQTFYPGDPSITNVRLTLRYVLHMSYILYLCRSSVEAQENMFMREFCVGWAVRAAKEPEDEIIKSGTRPCSTWTTSAR